jgi:cation diffusion facilitator CzcD-associated flavoprotein CzcO
MRRMLLDGAAQALPEGYEVDKHFKPRYRPWDQRLCLVPDSDLFKAISAGRASVVTDEIETFTDRGIRLKSGAELEGDIIVSATGLQMLALGAVQLAVDGAPVDTPRNFIYKGTMLSNVPNFAFCIGYTNARGRCSADLASTFVCRVLNHMDRHGYRTCRPACEPAALEERPLLNLESGYVQRASRPAEAGRDRTVADSAELSPDSFTMKLSRLEDGILQFGKAAAVPRTDVPEEVCAVGD